VKSPNANVGNEMGIYFCSDGNVRGRWLWSLMYDKIILKSVFIIFKNNF
jgi:hypothetical protein